MDPAGGGIGERGPAAICFGYAKNKYKHHVKTMYITSTSFNISCSIECNILYNIIFILCHVMSRDVMLNQTGIIVSFYNDKNNRVDERSGVYVNMFMPSAELSLLVFWDHRSP